jgi:hypothetical protein
MRVAKLDGVVDNDQVALDFFNQPSSGDRPN